MPLLASLSIGLVRGFPCGPTSHTKERRPCRRKGATFLPKYLVSCLCSWLYAVNVLPSYCMPFIYSPMYVVVFCGQHPALLSHMPKPGSPFAVVHVCLRIGNCRQSEMFLSSQSEVFLSSQGLTLCEETRIGYGWMRDRAAEDGSSFSCFFL